MVNKGHRNNKNVKYNSFPEEIGCTSSNTMRSSKHNLLFEPQ